MANNYESKITPNSVGTQFAELRIYKNRPEYEVLYSNQDIDNVKIRLDGSLAYDNTSDIFGKQPIKKGCTVNYSPFNIPGKKISFNNTDSSFKVNLTYPWGAYGDSGYNTTTSYHYYDSTIEHYFENRPFVRRLGFLESNIKGKNSFRMFPE